MDNNNTNNNQNNNKNFGRYGYMYGYGIKENKVDLYWKEKYENEASKFWNKFYKNNKGNFFKDRHWIQKEWNQELKKAEIILEAGCGVGNSIFPLLQENLKLFIWAIDFSPYAIQILQKNPLYDSKRCISFVCDLVKEPLPSSIVSNSVDYILCIFILSSINPQYIKPILLKFYQILKIGGCILFRDYAVDDMAQKRFEKQKSDKEENKLEENFYVRGDGTRAFFFDQEFLNKLFTSVGFKVIECKYIYKEVENKKENKFMKRTFIQGKFQK